MEFDCWSGLLIEGKPYTIVEKIRYKENTSDDVWTEYGLITHESDHRIWLSIADGGLSCTLSVAVEESKPPKGYRLHDVGTEVVTGVWGDTDAAVGDMAKYEQYESADGTLTFFVEDRWGSRSGSAGRKLDAAAIVRDETAPAPRWNALRIRLKNGVRESVTSVALVVLVCGGLVFLTDVIPNLSVRDWHSFRSFVGSPYTMHERLSDAPYCTEQREEDGARICTAQVDAATAALDLIEGIDGNVQDAYEDLGDAECPLVIRTQTETARITSTADGRAHIVVTATSPDLTPAAEKLERGYVLMRYAELVRTGDQRGRAVVVLQESPRADTPSAAPADRAASATAAAPPTTAPAPTTSASEETPRRMRHLAH